MKHLFPIFALAAFLLASVPASAQISIDEVNAEQQSVTFQDKLKSTSVDVDYFNLARYKAERAAIRKERNYLEFGGGLQGALTSYNDPWIATSGGDNSIALVATFNLKHIFTKDLFTIETKFNAKLGYNRMKVTVDDKEEGIWFKNQDEFEISTAPSFKMTKNGSYGSILNFRSQFVNGYKSRTEQEEADLKSKFMTPAYLDISLGITYKSPEKKFPITVNMSPLALNATFAENDWIRRRQVEERVDSEGKKTETEIKPAYNYGIEDPDKTSKYEGGSSIQIDFDRKFGNRDVLRYRTTFFSFYGWISNLGQKNKIAKFSDYIAAYDKWEADGKDQETKPTLPIHPTVRWENTLDIKPTKYLTTSINFQLYYNRAQSYAVQTQAILSGGLSYTFQNKPKPKK